MAIKISQLTPLPAATTNTRFPVIEAGINYGASFGNIVTFVSNNLSSMPGNLSVNILSSTNNGNGTNFKVGDDAWIGDVNISNALAVRGVQDAGQGYIIFGNANNTTYIGRNGTGPITATGNFAVTGTVAIGTDANFTDWGNAKVVVSQANTGHSHSYNMGIVGEAVAHATDPNSWGIGVYGRGNTNGAQRSSGILGDGGVTATGDTGSSIGVRGYADDTHAGGLNIGLFGSASNSVTGNYALYMKAGGIYSDSAQNWDLYDNHSTALSLNTTGKSGILSVKTTDNSEGVSMSGTLSVTGITTVKGINEAFILKTGATGVIAHDYSAGTIFSHSSIAADFTVNLTNLTLPTLNTTNITLALTQGSSAYIPSAFQIATVAQSIKWQGGSAPTGNANKTDIVSFSIMNNAGTYTVLGQLVTFG